ncbi:hypothetical protein chiPu_0009298 [Chiloscyllium punctatum]|uniref:Uncharacterized protein n=1 Tax=Chiloscyllium punctatum TaxID=137246 RepID=A0A401SKC4_CHIPU|nr:hypothetical protein [Chiloscyllium punctatum]
MSVEACEGAGGGCSLRRPPALTHRRGGGDDYERGAGRCGSGGREESEALAVSVLKTQILNDGLNLFTMTPSRGSWN